MDFNYYSEKVAQCMVVGDKVNANHNLQSVLCDVAAALGSNKDRAVILGYIAVLLYRITVYLISVDVRLNKVALVSLQMHGDEL